jgi:hypothetical protein
MTVVLDDVFDESITWRPEIDKINCVVEMKDQIIVEGYRWEWNLFMRIEQVVELKNNLTLFIVQIQTVGWFVADSQS